MLFYKMTQTEDLTKQIFTLNRKYPIKIQLVPRK